MSNSAIICIPTWSTQHHLLSECVQNVRETSGVEPVVWQTAGNVAVARDEASAAMDTEYICFLDTDAFPQEKGWLDRLVRTADETNATIVSPTEVLWFSPTNMRVLGPKVGTSYRYTGVPGVAGMCVLVRRGQGKWDHNIGLTHGELGPCIEDTDFAYSVAAAGGIHMKEPRVHVLHKDRGAPDFDTWSLSHEFLCYRIMALLLQEKWRIKDPVKRAKFFSAIKSVPAGSQRFLASGYSIDDLIACYTPVIENLSGAGKMYQRVIEGMAQSYLRRVNQGIVERWVGRPEVPHELLRDIGGTRKERGTLSS
jgi:hypothetical protein